MTGKWMYRIALAAVVLETALVLVLWSRGEFGPILPFAMLPFAAASLVPSGLAAIGLIVAGHDKRKCLVALAMTGVMAIPALIDLCVPLSNQGWEPELEPAGRVVFFVLPLQIPFGLVALFASGVVATADRLQRLACEAAAQASAVRPSTVPRTTPVAESRPPSVRGPGRGPSPGPLSAVRMF